MTTKYMKVALLSLILIPTLTFAAIERDLFYGSRGDDVVELQDFLTNEGFYTGPITGNFFFLTRSAVQKWQKSVDLPSSGYFGKLSRAEFNAIAEFSASGTDESEDQPNIGSPALSSTDTLLKEQNKLLQEQIERQRIAQVQADIQARLTTTPTPSSANSAPATTQSINTVVLAPTELPSYFTFVASPTGINSTVSVNKTDTRIGSYVIQSGPNTTMNVYYIKIYLSGDASVENTHYLRVQFSEGGSSSAVYNPSYSSEFTTKLTVTPGTTQYFDVYGDIGSTTGTITTSMQIAGSLTTGVSTTTQTVIGQTITVQ